MAGKKAGDPIGPEAKVRKLMKDAKVGAYTDKFIAHGYDDMTAFINKHGKLLVTEEKLMAAPLSMKAGHASKLFGHLETLTPGGAAAAAGAAPAAAAAAAAADWREDKDVASFAEELMKDTEKLDHDLELIRVPSKGFAGSDASYPKGKYKRVLIFFRKEVRQLVGKIVSEKQPWSAMIGTPGIGKSSALYYQLRTVLKESGKQTVLFEHRGEGAVFRFEKAAGGKISAFVIDLEDWRPMKCPYVHNEKNWRLIDPKKGAGRAIWTPGMSARTTMASSPNIKNHFPMEDLWKEGNPYTAYNYYLPVWDKESLKVASLLNNEFAKGKPKAAHEAEFEKMYYDFGGTPRHVWSTEHVAKTIRMSRRKAMTDGGVGEMAKSMLLGEDFQMKDKDNVLHKLFAIQVTDEFEEDKTMPVSRKAAALLAKQYWKPLMARIKAGQYGSAAESGIFFEAIAHEWLANGGEFLDVVSGKKKKKKLTIEKQPTVLVDGADKEFLAQFEAGTKGYVKPTYQCLACVDSADAGANRVYEITVAEEKKIKTEHIDKYIAKRPNKKKPLEFVRVIPTFRAPGEKKPFKTRIKGHDEYKANKDITERVIVLGLSG